MVISRLLRFALLADASATAGTGLLMFALNGVLAPVLGIPASLLLYAGLALLPYAAVVGYLGSRVRISAAAVWAVIGLNVLWAVDSVALLFTDWIAPTLLGTVFVVAQAVIVGVFAELQYAGLRRSQAAEGTAAKPDIGVAATASTSHR